MKLCIMSSPRFLFFFSSRRRHTRWNCDWSSDVCSSDLWPDQKPVRAPTRDSSQICRGGMSRADAVDRCRSHERTTPAMAILAEQVDAVVGVDTHTDTHTAARSEERRVGKESRSREAADA